MEKLKYLLRKYRERKYRLAEMSATLFSGNYVSDENGEVFKVVSHTVGFAVLSTIEGKRRDRRLITVDWLKPVYPFFVADSSLFGKWKLVRKGKERCLWEDKMGINPWTGRL